MAVTQTLVDYLTKEITRNLDLKTIIKPFANTQFEGILKQQGDTVKVAVLPVINWRKGGTAGAAITASNFTISQESLVVNKVAQINQTFADIDAVRYNRNLQDDIAARVGEAQARLIDSFIASLVRDNATVNKLNRANPTAVTKSTVLDDLLSMSTALEGQNVDAKDAKLFIDPTIKALLISGTYIDATELGARMRMNGEVGQVAGMQTFSTNNLPYTVDLLIATQPTATDTITITGKDSDNADVSVVFTWVAAASASAAGDVSIGANLAAAQANLVNAINNTGTAGASTYVAVSAANRLALENIDVFAEAFGTHTTNVMTLYANQLITTAQTHTVTTDVFSNPSKLAFAMMPNTINMAMQLNKMKIKDAIDGFSYNLLGEMVYGGKVFTENGKAIVTLRYDVTNANIN